MEREGEGGREGGREGEGGRGREREVIMLVVFVIF